MSVLRPFWSVGLPVLLAGALAAAPASAKPGHAGGTRIDWPLKRATTTVAPGTTLTVTVRRTGHGARSAPVTVSLVRLTQKGRPMRRIATRRAREGKLTVRVPAGDGRLYELRLTLGRLHQVGRVRTPAAPVPATPAPPAPAPTPTPSPAPPPAPTPWDDCPADGTLAATLRLDAPDTPVHPGDRIAFTLTDTGTGCLLTGAGGGLQRRADDGTWVTVPQTEPVPAIAFVVKPGRELSTSVRVPDDAPPGRYRVIKSVDAARAPSTVGDPQPGLSLDAELDVVP